MTRPGFCLEVDERTPRLLMLQGATVGTHRYDNGTAVLCASEPGAVSDTRDVVSSALATPVAGRALAEVLSPSSRLTIVVGDIPSPRPSISNDPRRVMVEAVLRLAAEAGTDDVQILFANGLQRRATRTDMLRTIGERAVRSFEPVAGLLRHDVTSDDLFEIGDHDGVPVRVHPRVASSDLVVEVHLRDDHTESADRSLAHGITGIETIDQMAGLHGSPEKTAAVAGLIREHSQHVLLEAVLGQPQHQGLLSFLSRREWEWSRTDRIKFAAIQRAQRLAPHQTAQQLFGELSASRELISVSSGDPAAVQSAGIAAWVGTHRVHLSDPANLLIVPVAGRGSDPTTPAGDPLAAAFNGLVTRPRCFGTGALTTPEAVFVGLHPMTPSFSTRHHSTSADFFSDVLANSTDPQWIATQYQERFVNDSWYLELYRDHSSFHPLHVVHRWYATAAAAQRYRQVIWVGADRATVRRLGFRSATRLSDAQEIARAVLGDTPRVVAWPSVGSVVAEVS